MGSPEIIEEQSFNFTPAMVYLCLSPNIWQNSKHEGLSNIGCLSMFMFFKPYAVDIEFEEWSKEHNKNFIHYTR